MGLQTNDKLPNGFQRAKNNYGWSDMIKLHDKFRAIVSAKNKRKDQHIKQLHKSYLKQQMRENEARKRNLFVSKEKDEWNTIEQQGYNDDVLHRKPLFRSHSKADAKLEGDSYGLAVNATRSISPKIAAPEWSDPAIKYIQKSIGSRENLNKTTNNSSTSKDKHFLYPLLNRTKRMQFRKTMEQN